MDTITVCMGSSCFGKGNAGNAEFISRFIAEHHLEDRAELSGSLCCGLCARGPNVKINDRVFSGVSEEALGRLMTTELGPAK